MPFQHPHYETPRQRHRRLFREDITAFLREASERREAYRRARILPSVA